MPVNSKITTLPATPLESVRVTEHPNSCAAPVYTLVKLISGHWDVCFLNYSLFILSSIARSLILNNSTMWSSREEALIKKWQRVYVDCSWIRPTLWKSRKKCSVWFQAQEKWQFLKCYLNGASVLLFLRVFTEWLRRWLNLTHSWDTAPNNYSISLEWKKYLILLIDLFNSSSHDVPPNSSIVCSTRPKLVKNPLTAVLMTFRNLYSALKDLSWKRILTEWVKNLKPRLIGWLCLHLFLGRLP